jgi:osmoprotectant transport system permease protein
MTDDKRRNPVLASLSVLMVLALSGLPFLQLAPNRLVSGQPLYFFSIIHGSAWSLLMVLVMLAALVLLTTLLLVAMFKPRTAWLWAVLTVAAVCMPSLLWLAANQASISLQGELPIARTSLTCR